MFKEEQRRAGILMVKLCRCPDRGREPYPGLRLGGLGPALIARARRRALARQAGPGLAPGGGGGNSPRFAARD
jgi:hypothetical protein